MSKLKKLEQDIQALKALVLHLQAQVIALQARNSDLIVMVPQIQTTPSWSPYVGDFPCTVTTTTYSKQDSNDNTQISRCVQ
jgi:hypothetical protein